MEKSTSMHSLRVDEGDEGEEEINARRAIHAARKVGTVNKEKKGAHAESEDTGEMSGQRIKKPKVFHDEKAEAAPSSVSEGASRVDWDAAEEVRFVMRPWLKADGSLNRRVLDRMLGGLLSHVMSRPGQSAECVCRRFAPALQPAHSLELVEVLRELGCLSAHVVRGTAEPVRLFDGDGDSGPGLELAEAGLLDDPAKVVLEPTVDAVVRLGQFIGDKLYNVDFVCQCPCHPDKSL